VRNQGNADVAFRAAAKPVAAEYFAPYLAHATMEPPVAVAIPDNGRIVILAPSQNPQEARTVVARYLGLKDTDVSVRVTLVGGGFGRKAMHDCVCEAAWWAHNPHVPVKMAWTRQDDIRHGYYHPICAQRIEGGIDKNGAPIGWHHRTAFPAIGATFDAT